MLVFDKDYNLVDLAYEQLDAAYMQPVGNVNKLPMQKLSVSKTIKEPGYVYIYISNEGSVQQDVFFDDFRVTHQKSPIIQANDYYPFGLTFNSYQRENSVTNQYQYNGKEMQDELGLAWLDYGARMYMSDVGRWGVIDPLAGKASSWTPYRYAFNNPLLFIDPDGMFEYSDGYSKLDSRESTGSLSHYGVFSNGDGEFTLPSGPEGIDTEVWEEYSPKEHTGHDKYWRNKENGAFLAFDKGVEGKKGHFHLYTDSNFKTRIDANGNLSGTAKGMAKGSNRFHLKPRTTVNLTALSKTMSKLSNAFVVVDLLGVFSQRPDSPWASRSGINPNATENRAYGLFDQNNPVSPIIYEFNKIGNDTIEVRFYESYYWNADFGFWRGSGMYRKDVYVQDAASGNYIRLD